MDVAMESIIVEKLLYNRFLFWLWRIRGSNPLPWARPLGHMSIEFGYGTALAEVAELHAFFSSFSKRLLIQNPSPQYNLQIASNLPVFLLNCLYS